ncbi:hypothetical protein DBR42_22010 [Pelomonas sp. HMWF004]|nr:hypothetical protein DBR42_22010 [Pelomonas sp. HMWF004]
MNSASPSSVAVAAPDSLWVRPVQPADFDAWLPLWESYNAFYGRQGSSALPTQITESTWARFFDPDEPVFALVAQAQEQLMGLAHHLLHRSTIRI